MFLSASGVFQSETKGFSEERPLENSVSIGKLEKRTHLPTIWNLLADHEDRLAGQVTLTSGVLSFKQLYRGFQLHFFLLFFLVPEPP